METKKSFWQQNSAMLKMALITILILLLLIPSFMVRELIRERQRNQESVIYEVAEKWGREQTIAGPIISIPFTLAQTREHAVQIEYAHFLPESCHTLGNVKAQFRSRNIFKVIGYRADFLIKGKLKRPDLSSFGKKIESNFDLSGCFIQVPVSDLKGIKEKVFLEVDGRQYELNPGLQVHDISSSGLWYKISLDDLFGDKNTVEYSIHFKKLDGTQRLNFLPLGRETTVNLKANWPSPSFDGNFIPEKHDIKKTGFTADWKILSLNRNFPQSFTGSGSQIYESSFGVSLIEPVNHYLLSERSAKYAILFISLTFLTFFFCEITANQKIHPIQYILIGLALVLFFSLLLSLSEQIGFDKAYWTAASGIVLMISLYAQSIIKRLRLTLIIAGIMIFLYGFIYIILQLENYALLFGSIGLFVILGLVMFISRKIDWYNLADRK